MYFNHLSGCRYIGYSCISAVLHIAIARRNAARLHNLPRPNCYKRGGAAVHDLKVLTIGGFAYLYLERIEDKFVQSNESGKLVFRDSSPVGPCCLLSCKPADGLFHPGGLAEVA